MERDTDPLRVGESVTLTVRRAVTWAAMFCCAIQLVSATFFVRHFGTPNASMQIAKYLIETGKYQGGFWEIVKGPNAQRDGEPKAFQLPGQALFVAFLLRFVPQPLHRYAHVPITTLFVASVACVAALAGGPLVGLLAGVIASLEPFIVLHGPVWEDTIFSAALVWTIIALLYARIRRDGASATPRHTWTFAVIALLSGCAALLRTESQVILVLVALGALVLPSLRAVRREAAAALLGIAIALGAWGLRNQRAVGEFTVTTSHDGIVLFLSTNQHARQAVAYGQIDRFINATTIGAEYDAVANMSEMDANRYFRRQATAYMMAHPFDVMKTAGLKIAVTLAGIRPELRWLSKRNLPALAVNGSMLLLTACWISLALARRIRVDAALVWLLGIVACAALAVLAIGPIGWRYRITIDGVLWLASAWALVHFSRSLRPAQS
jgi:hypothetical protein